MWPQKIQHVYMALMCNKYVQIIIYNNTIDHQEASYRFDMFSTLFLLFGVIHKTVSMASAHFYFEMSRNVHRIYC